MPDVRSATAVDVARLRAALDVDEVTAIARELVRCPSPNPPGDEEAVARTAARLLCEAGGRDVTTVVAGQRRASVVGRWGASGGRVLAWNGHLDVVPAPDEQWLDPPYSGAIRDGRLWGRGAADMKGSIACALQALRIIQRAGLEPAGEVVFSLVADEECGGRYGAGHLHANGLLPAADAGICGEPTGLDVCTAARGRLWLEIETTGTSVHASDPDRGENAISNMLRVVDALVGADGSPGFTPTVIAGGDSPNSVPDRCTLTVDRRFSAAEGADAVRAAVLERIDRIRDTTGMRVSVTERACLDASEIDPEAEIVRVARDAVAAVTGRRADVGEMRAATDARFLVEAGIPTIIFGPGELAQAHTVDESIAIDELVEGSLAYAAAICSFLGTR